MNSGWPYRIRNCSGGESYISGEWPLPIRSGFTSQRGNYLGCNKLVHWPASIRHCDLSRGSPLSTGSVVAGWIVVLLLLRLLDVCNHDGLQPSVFSLCGDILLEHGRIHPELARHRCVSLAITGFRTVPAPSLCWIYNNLKRSANRTLVQAHPADDDSQPISSRIGR